MGAAREVEPPPAQDEEPEDDEEEEAAGGDGEPGAASPWNIMIKHRLVQRRGRRSQMMTSFTDPVVSMDLLRAVLQPSINEEIQAVFGKYMKFFQKAAGNVRENVGEDVDTEQLIQETCRSCLEQAKLLFCDGKRPIARVAHEVAAIKRAKPLEDEVSQQGSPIPKKRKGRPPGQSQPGDRGASAVGTAKSKSCEPVQREGPKWDPLRLTETTNFVLGSRANKALGMGGTRGRLYIKHPHLFKAYLLLEEDIQDLAASEEYRGSQELRLEELKPFPIPSWMIGKMQRYMKNVRSEGDQPLPQPQPLSLPEEMRET
ncbi:deoxynucleotidyltransferase terminal-interacting protein 1 isoform X2 [Erythrolamprus reginae]|uniref:deoxynucleotidyltransferase terminal-interacting protein 1 isoform X2 n=1 Tax=Erythrolamprus reginae TaxID=121349 RepID=UPI00396C46D6